MVTLLAPVASLVNARVGYISRVIRDTPAMIKLLNASSFSVAVENSISRRLEFAPPEGLVRFPLS